MSSCFLATNLVSKSLGLMKHPERAKAGCRLIPRNVMSFRHAQTVSEKGSITDQYHSLMSCWDFLCGRPRRKHRPTAANVN